MTIPMIRVSTDGRFVEVGRLPDPGLQNLGSGEETSGPTEGAPTSPPWRRLDGVTGPESRRVLPLLPAPSSAVQLNPEARAAVIESVRHRLVACGSDVQAKGHVLQWAKDATGWSEGKLAAALAMSRPYVYRLVRERDGDAVKRDAPGLRPTAAAVDRHAARLISGKVEVDDVLELFNACGRLTAAYVEALGSNGPSPQQPLGGGPDAAMPRSQAGQR